MDYTPDRGDIIWLNFTSQASLKKGGHLPALVLSPKEYNQKTGLAIMCPITSFAKGYPFEVALTTGSVQGVILSDQLKNLDWQELKISFKGKAPAAVLEEVMNKVSALLMLQ